MRETNSLTIVFFDLGIGGVQKKILDIVSQISHSHPDYTITLLLEANPGQTIISRYPSGKIHFVCKEDWFPEKSGLFRGRIHMFWFLLWHFLTNPSSTVLVFLPRLTLYLIKIRTLLFWKHLPIVVGQDGNLTEYIKQGEITPSESKTVSTAYQAANLILVPTQALKRDLVQNYGLISQSIAVIPNWTASSRNISTPKRYDCMYIGRFSKEKQLHQFAQLLDEMTRQKPDFRLGLMGSGPELATIKSVLHKYITSGNVMLLPPTDNPKAVLSLTRIYISISKTEGMPLTFLEAMVLGIPVVTLWFDGVGETIIDNKTGVVCLTFKQVCKSITKLLVDGDQYRTMSNNAIADAKKRFSVKNLSVYAGAILTLKPKIGLVTSAGGHLYQLWMLKKFWSRYNRIWIGVPKPDTSSLLARERVILAAYPESRNVANAMKNLFLAFQILVLERPDIVISAGAGIAPPFFLVAKCLKIKTLYIEPIDFIEKPSLTGRMLYALGTTFLIQNHYQRKFFPNAQYWGTTL